MWQELDHFAARDTAVARFVRAKRMEAAEAGLRLTVSRDFARLKEVWSANRDSWPTFMPTVDPDVWSDLDRRGFWVCGTDGDGRVVLTRACVLFETASMGATVRRLEVLYQRPEEEMLVHEFCTAAPILDQIGGVVGLSTAGWHHPSVRGRGLSRRMCHLVKALALDTPGPDWFLSFVDDRIAEGARAAYEPPVLVRRAMVWNGGRFGDLSMTGMLWPREEVRGYVAAA
jgi:RimJ/RimL family protein N-acetyltransferase